MWITYHGLEYGAQKRREVIDTVLSREKLMDFDYYQEYLVNINEYIKQSIIMTVLRKANSDSVEICRLMKNQYCERRSRRKSDLDFFSNCQVPKNECVAYYKTLFTGKRTT